MSKIVRKIWASVPSGFRMAVIRVTQQKFTVSVAAIITNPEGKVLLLNHVLRPGSSWGIPGGFIDGGEQPEAAIRREIQEETGIELEDLRLYRIRTIKRHVEILFRATSTGTAEVNSIEITELGWFAPSEMPAGISRIQKYMIEEVLASGV